MQLFIGAIMALVGMFTDDLQLLIIGLFAMVQYDLDYIRKKLG